MYQQQQVQYYQQSQTSAEEQQMKYVVQKDFFNFIGIANDVQEVINYFGIDSNHIMIDLYMNKLICQANMSNMIHCDEFERANTNNNEKYLQSQKRKLLEHLKFVLQQQNYDQRIISILEQYQMNNLSSHPVQTTMQSKKLQLKSNFNEKTATDIIQGIQRSEEEFSKIRNGQNVPQITQQQIQQYLFTRSQEAIRKLESNWKNKINDPMYESKPNPNPDPECCIIF